MSLKPRKVNFDAIWGKVHDAARSVIMLESMSRNDWNDRFYDVYALCTSYPECLTDRLYIETKYFLERHVKGITERLMKKVNLGQSALKHYYIYWNEFSKGIMYMNTLYGYMNNQHIKKLKISASDFTCSNGKNEIMKEIGELGLDIWKKHLLEPLKNNLKEELLEGIKYDRLREYGSTTGHNRYQGDAVMAGVINSFVNVEKYKVKHNLDFYEEFFETFFLEASREYYKEDSHGLLQECSTSLYMERVIQRIESENVRSRKFLYPSSYQKVTTECEQQMIGAHLAILHSDCKPMVEKELLSDLANMYRLLKSIHGAEKVLLRELTNHIKQKGLQALSGLSGESIATVFVENVLSIHKKYKKMIWKLFNGDSAFFADFDKAMVAIVNYWSKSSSQSPELLAKYCDMLLKKSRKGLSEVEIEEKLNDSITVFRYLEDKDIFQKFYSRYLAKRLIHETSHSMDLEERVVNSLKQLCGHEFTIRFHRMLTDMSLVDDLNAESAEFFKKSGINWVTSNHFVKVLQQGSWPLNQTSLSICNIPFEFEKTVKIFEQFYAKKFSGRKLIWLYHMTNCDVKLGYLNKTYIISMTMYQLVILLSFNELESLSYDDLAKATNLQTDVFPRLLQSLLDAKLLLCNTTEASSKSIISLNMKYTNKRTKFKISGTILKETPQEEEKTHRTVEEDRKMYLQAAIVRIMKSRKTLKHNLLIQEVISQSKARFVPSVPLIKNSIERLIDKGYLERFPEEADKYFYVA